MLENDLNDLNDSSDFVDGVEGAEGHGRLGRLGQRVNLEPPNYAMFEGLTWSSWHAKNVEGG
jgi:hypothetical protein